MCTPKDCILQAELTSPHFWGHQRWRGLWRIHHCLSVITASDALDEFFRKQSGDSGEAPDPKWVSARGLAMPIWKCLVKICGESVWSCLSFATAWRHRYVLHEFRETPITLPTMSFHLGQGCATLAEIRIGPFQVLISSIHSDLVFKTRWISTGMISEVEDIQKQVLFHFMMRSPALVTSMSLVFSFFLGMGIWPVKGSVFQAPTVFSRKSLTTKCAVPTGRKKSSGATGDSFLKQGTNK